MAEQSQSRALTLLVDHNIEGHALMLWGMLSETGWLEVLGLRLMRLRDVGLPEDSTDRQVWRYAQAHEMLLFTDNRNMENDDSLEQTIREENSTYSFPVLTIGSVARLAERGYREECVERLIEIAIYLDDYMGVGRLYIP
jgi:hypothetical protein